MDCSHNKGIEGPQPLELTHSEKEKGAAPCTQLTQGEAALYQSSRRSAATHNTNPATKME